MKTEITIRDASVSDAEELLKIYAPYITDTAITYEYDVPSVAEFAERIRTTSEKYPYLVALLKDGTYAGYAYAGAFKEREAYRYSVETSIYIRRDLRRGGIGRALYEELESRLKEIGIRNVNACIAFPDPEDEYLTEDSVRFHEKLGYSMVGRFHKCAYKFGRWYDMVWMERFIGDHH